MIALLIGGTVVLCVGVLAIVFGIPVKEFSFGNTMILAGSVVACTGLLLIGLYMVGRELQNLARQLGSRVPAQPLTPQVPTPNAPVTAEAPARPLPPPLLREPRAAERKEETLFPRDQPALDDFAEDRLSPGASLPSASAPSFSIPRPAEPAPRPRIDGAERERRNILFSSTRREPAQDAPIKPEDDFSAGESHATELENSRPFESAWPQQDRPHPEPDFSDVSESRDPESRRDRYQPARRADATSVTVVKSGVVDSMAYSLYSDGSIEAQMPEGMVRFASLEELRTHLDQRA